MGHVGYTPAHLTQARPEPPSAAATIYLGHHIYRRLFALGGSSHSSLIMGIQSTSVRNHPTAQLMIICHSQTLFQQPFSSCSRVPSGLVCDQPKCCARHRQQRCVTIRASGAQVSPRRSSPVVIYLKELNQSKVALICGGGSGHEPAHSGFVGELIPLCRTLHS